MSLVVAEKAHVIELMSWFPDQFALESWSGPGFRYPFTEASFIEDLNPFDSNSFVLLSEQQELLAFGQFYLREGRCHLARLAVNPKFRGKGIAAELMQGLMSKGSQLLKVDECSLFVLTHNEPAIRAYQKLGFEFAEYPDQVGLDNCLYMCKCAVKR